MLVITPFHPGDADQALRMFAWIRDLEGRQIGHDLLLIADSRCLPMTVAEIWDTAHQAFRSVETLPFTDHFQKWPEAPNAVFAFAARHVMSHQNTPWLFLEPDCCPLTAGWLDAIETEYNEVALPSGKFFMGARVEVNDVPLHMSGNAVYPADMFAHAGLALIANDIAFDVAAAQQIVPQAHFTKLIEHAWKHPTFESWEQVEREVSKEAALYHSSKDGSLIVRLREKKNGLTINPEWERAAYELEYPTGIIKERGFAERKLTCDILIKSYPKDYERLRYCLRSLDKFAVGFRNTVILFPKGEGDGISGPGCSLEFLATTKTIAVEESGDPYLFQQAVKANAHEYTDADFILHIDSDTILSAPVTPGTFLRDGKPLWLLTPYTELQEPNALSWKAVTEKFLGESVEFEFMRRMPMFVPRFLHVAAAAFCLVHHKMSLSNYILAQPDRKFSEFNALGALAYSRAREEFSWLGTTKEPLPETVAIQKWSHDPFTEETKAEFDTILSGHGEQQPQGPNVDPLPAQNISGDNHEHITNAVMVSGRGSDHNPCHILVDGKKEILTPWESPLESITEVRSLPSRLQKFCTGGAHTRKVREELHEAGIIQLPYRFKKRRGWKQKRKMGI